MQVDPERDCCEATRAETIKAGFVGLARDEREHGRRRRRRVRVGLRLRLGIGFRDGRPAAAAPVRPAAAAGAAVAPAGARALRRRLDSPARTRDLPSLPGTRLFITRQSLPFQFFRPRRLVCARRIQTGRRVAENICVDRSTRVLPNALK